ncbi:MAG: RedB protein [Armatimonadota bacterium]|nr:RedB protein [Armatimonadota bacterium]
MKTRLVLITSGIVWLLAVVAGLGVMLNYENSPGVAATAPVQWPTNSRIRLAPDRPTLVMLAHPRCPCTRASIGELALLMARCQGKVTAYVLFLKPAGTASDWAKTDLWQSAAAIPGVQVVRDDGGVEARRFGVETSGQTMLFDSAGRLLFSGGITAARGHSGDNAGRSVIVSLLTTGMAERHQTFVFGCSLRDPAKSLSE